MSNLIPLSHPDFGRMRVHLDEKGNPWWVAKDVCRVLGLTNPSVVVSALDDDEKDDLNLTDTIGRAQKMALVNEPGLYSLVLRSRKPLAKKFKRWLTHDVMPALRETGSYALPKTARRREPARLTRTEKVVKGSVLSFLFPNLGNKVLAKHPDFLSLKPLEQVRILTEAYPPALAE